MKTSNNFQNALPACFELLNIISTDFFFSFFSKVKTKSGTFPEMSKTVISSFNEKIDHMFTYIGCYIGYHLTHISLVRHA